MVLKKWADGYRLYLDPRNEDPTFYYLRNEWAEAVGFRVQPLFEHATATSVSIDIAPRSVTVAMTMPSADRMQMYGRVFETIAGRYRQWAQMVIEIQDTLIASQEFADGLETIGWTRTDCAERGCSFVRA